LLPEEKIGRQLLGDEQTVERTFAGRKSGIASADNIFIGKAPTIKI